jgi:predicted PurR-regulated permease PerM
VASHTSPTEASATTAHDVRRFALSIIAGGVIIAVLYFGRAVFITSLIAVIIAFILDPFVSLLTRIRLPRAVGSFLICSLALLFLYVIGAGVATLRGPSPDFADSTDSKSHLLFLSHL